jgi:epoxyqueuosine reductase
MQGAELSENVFKVFKNQGFTGIILSIQRIAELQRDILTQYQKGLFDEEFYNEELTGFEFKIPGGFPKTASLIIVAAPQPHVRVSFSREGKSYSYIIPPTYSYKTDRRIENLLELQLEPAGFHAVKTILPLKLLAVRSGLAQYGKNNITYIRGMGSFYRLAAFISDLPCSEDSWGEPQMMEHCEHCNACMKACPTGAIAPNRFLLHGDRCLTYHNERKPAFPDWIKPSWHNCLVGCLYCQKACPVNKNYVELVEQGPVFSEEETSFLLQDTPYGKIPQNTIPKIERLDLIENLDVIGRNLQVLLEKQQTL